MWRVAALLFVLLVPILGEKAYARDIGVCMVGQLRGPQKMASFTAWNFRRCSGATGICNATDLLSFFQAPQLLLGFCGAGSDFLAGFHEALCHS